MMLQPPADRLGGAVQQHLDWFCAHAPWGEQTWAPGLWWAQLDVRTGAPVSGERAPGVSKRCYRLIESPGGSNLYWDGPLVVAMRGAARRFGEPRWATIGERYVRQYLAQGTSESDLLWWGNHYYLHRDAGGPVVFGEVAEPVGAAHADAPLHETRPLPVAWALLAELDAEHTSRNLAAQEGHLNRRPGAAGACGEAGFDRHASGTDEHCFLEAGAMLALSQAWRAKLTGERRGLDVADAVLRFSFGHRDERTSLLPVSPTSNRWDNHQATSEIGLWAGAAMAAAELCDQPDWRDLAVQALGAWVERAWDERAGRFAGRLHTQTGDAITTPQSTIYQPGRFADPWEPLFPAHDYPMPTAEACLTAWATTGEAVFELAARRWVEVIERSLPARNGRGGYAEHYGRVIHFLWRAGQMLGDAGMTELAWRVADESLAVLDAGHCLRSHPWEDRCEAVDGMGWLIMAWLALIDEAVPETMGLI